MGAFVKNVTFDARDAPVLVERRLHRDLSPQSTMAAEVDRLGAAGATVQRRVDEGESHWTVMLDPEGNEFCVLRGPDDDPPRARPS